MKPFRIAIAQPHTQLYPEMWLDVLSKDRQSAVQKALDYKKVKLEDLPIEIHIGSNNKLIHDTGIPMVCDTLTLGE